MFAQLHTHSEFSLLDGLCRIPDLVAHAREIGLGAVALTDHGSLYGAVDFYREAQRAGIKPIIGVEGYVAPQGRTSRQPGDKQPYHLVLLARNQEGYHNLLKLVTIAHLEGFYYRPRMDREVLEKHGAGLIALSACLAGEVPRAIMDGRMDDAREAALWHKETFDGYYLELQRHPGINDLDRLNEGLIALSEELDIPLVATNDLHYVRQEDSEAQDVLLCIQTNATVSDANRMRMEDDSFYLKSEDEMRELFSDVPEAVDNAWKIAEQCELELEFNRLHLPQIDLPQGMTSFEYLEQVCWAGFERRYGPDQPAARERVRYELDVIRQMEFSDYFLVVWDLVAYARKAGILIGVRGSAAASAVLYCLDITDIEPLGYGLVFERFLNLERKEMPDIDLDIEDARRDEVTDYVMRKFGHDRVAQIITFGTLGARAAIRDVGRALGKSFGDVDRVARLLPTGAHPTPLRESLERVPAFREAYEGDTEVRAVVDMAIKLEGVARHASTHAAGVVISREPLVNVVPLQRPSKSADGEEDSIPMTQWDMNRVAEVGLLKMDFLGLSNLTILARTRDLIAQTRGETLRLSDVPLDDERTYDLLSEGKTTGLFQLEGSGMRRWITRLEPRSLNDLSAMIALYRPGPMEHIPRFIESKMGRAPTSYPHNDLAEILAETYGVIVYQDQVLQIAQKFAGYSLGRADIVRKAMGKKIPEIMAAEGESFVRGALERGYARDDAQAVFDLIEPFAGYAFNKAHSVSYAYIAYLTAYFKANYATEYMTSLLNAHIGQQERMGADAEECRSLGITVAAPHVNHSGAGFTIEGDPRAESPVIRVGLGAIKNVGSGAVEALIAERETGGPFVSVDDFVNRADLRSLNRRALESLVRAGGLDGLGPRASLLASAERMLALSSHQQHARNSQQTSMFDQPGMGADFAMPTLELENAPDPVEGEMGAWEKELTGIYFTEDPYQGLRAALGNRDTTLCNEIVSDMEGQRVSVAGIVASVRPFTSRGEPAASLVLTDQSGAVDVTVWPDIHRTAPGAWHAGAQLLISGQVRVRDDRASVDCRKFETLNLSANASGSQESPSTVNGTQPVPTGTGNGSTPARTAPAATAPPPREAAAAVAANQSPTNRAPQAVKNSAATPSALPTPAPERPRYQVHVSLKETQDVEADVERLNEIILALQNHPGNDAVRLVIYEADEAVPMELPLETAYGPELETAISAIIGPDAVTAQPMLI